jgi:hydroxymethylpyrimidine pyrophosphatase-like HAD family hydrolase
MRTNKDHRGLSGIVLDIDGTLLDPWHRVAPATAAAVERARAAGLHVLLASGRSARRRSSPTPPPRRTRSRASTGSRSGGSRATAGGSARAGARFAAIGDAENDIMMLRAAGVAIAMGNAAPDVIAVADRVTGTNARNGAAAAIDALLDAR